MDTLGNESTPLPETSGHEKGSGNSYLFYPTFEVDENCDNQEDPLGSKIEMHDISTIKQEPITVEDDFENSPIISNSFSIVDPSNVVQPHDNLVKAEPSTENLNESETEKSSSPIVEAIITNLRVTRTANKRRRSLEDNSIGHETKKLKMEAQSNADLKKMTINIGPRLSLPNCTTKNALSSSFSSTCESNHIVLKIYTCPKCSLKCTDLSLHEDHVSKCTNSKIIDGKSLISESSHRNGFYHCDICSFRFRHIENLIIHFEKHLLDKRFVCSICEYNSPTVNSLRNHCKELHKGLTNIFSCNICDYATADGNLLRSHMICHCIDKSHYCYICRHNYEDSADFDKHQLTIHNKTAKKHFGVKKSNDKNPNKLPEHYTNENLSEIKCKFLDEIIYKGGVYFCSGCPYRFSTQKNLKLHKEQHIKTNVPHKCVWCDFRTFSLIELNKHVNTHTQEKKFECNICNLLFSNCYYLRFHAVTHIYDELFCWECKCNFENTESLQLHFKFQHKNQGKLYSCPKCSFSHFNIQGFRSHFKLHKHQEYRLRLKGLKNTFMEDGKYLNSSESTAPKKLRKPQKQNNKNDKHPVKTKWAFKCGKCDYTCSQYDLLIKHNTSAHIHNGTPFNCSECDFKTTRTKYYVDHATSHVNGVKYGCRYCKYVTKEKSKFEKHDSMHRMKNCPMCNFKCLHAGRFVEHLRIHKQKNGDGYFSCSLCPYFCRSANILSTHTLKFHPREFLSLKLPFPVKFSLPPNSRSCVLCSYRTSRYHDVKRHLVRHFIKKSKKFSNHSVSTKSNNTNEKMNNPLKKKQVISKGVKKNVTLKVAIPNIKKMHVQEDDLRNDHKVSVNVLKRNDSNLYYKCSQCKYENTGRGSVAHHLIRKHNIIGGVRNNMILKVSVPTVPSNYNSVKDIALLDQAYYKCFQCKFKSEHRKSVVHHLQLMHNITEPVSNSMIINVSKKKTQKEKTNKKAKANGMSNPYYYYKCYKCKYKSVHKKSVVSHLSVKHSSIGAASKLNILRVPARILPTKKGQQKKIVPESIDNAVNGFYYYQCTLCPYKNTSRRTVSNHQLVEHNIHGGVRNNMILRVPFISQPVKLSISETIDTESETPNKRIKMTKNINSSELSNMIIKPEASDEGNCVKCSKCKIHTFSRMAQIDHFKHGHAAFWKKPFSCKRCGGTRYSCKSSFYRHNSRFHKDPLKCVICKSFVTHNVDSLVSHQKTCTNSMIEEVNDENPCGEEESDNKVNTEELQGSDDENYSCGECEYVTQDVTDLITHMFVHTGIPDD